MALQNIEANITLDLYNHDTTPATVKAIQLDSQTRYVAAMLQSMGAEKKLIRRIFVLEGWMISLVGLAGGLAAGITFSLLQQHFGFIKMPGHFIVQAYPVILSWTDILLTIAGVAVIGYVIALLPVASFYKRSR